MAPRYAKIRGREGRKGDPHVGEVLLQILFLGLHLCDQQLQSRGSRRQQKQINEHQIFAGVQGQLSRNRD